MNHLIRNLIHDEAGFLVSSELVLISTIGVIGLSAGLVCVRDAVVSELKDVSCAIGSLNQSYCYSGFSASSLNCCKSSTPGSCFTDHEEGGIVNRVDVQGCLSTVTAPPAPVFEERIIEAPCVEDCVESEVVEEVVYPPAVIADGPVVESCTTCEPEAVAECEEATEEDGVVAEQTVCDRCAPKPLPQHIGVDECGKLLHYSETRGTVVRMIDEWDAYNRPFIVPRPLY